jgi:hypothetical protein
MSINAWSDSREDVEERYLACSKDPQWLKRQELGLTERSSRSVARSAPFRSSRI